MAIFSTEKTMENKKITKKDMLRFFKVGEPFLKPLIVKKITEVISLDEAKNADMMISAYLPNWNDTIEFFVSMKTSSTPLAVKKIIGQLKALSSEVTKIKTFPVIVVPYLSPERLAELEKEGVSGVDLCGNGLIILPGVYILRTGKKNLYPVSRPLNNPYKGLSAMVGRILLDRWMCSSLIGLQEMLANVGASMSLSQVSKTVQALADDLVVLKAQGEITLVDSDKLLEKLAFHWGEKSSSRRLGKGIALKLKDGLKTLSVLSKKSSLKWAVMGESSVQRYTSFSQGGPLKVAVSDIDTAIKLIGEDGVPEPINNFADVILYETDEPGFFFNRRTEGTDIYWAGAVQTYVELANGDGRQREAAKEIKKKLMDTGEL